MQHLLDLPEHMNEVYELINKVILLLRKLNKGKEYVTFLQNHNNRENIWIEWKKKKNRVLIPELVIPDHTKTPITINNCTANDRFNLCKKSNLHSLVCSVIS